MKIYIHEPEEEKDINLTIPNGVIFNKLGAMIAGRVIEENTQENTITKEQLKRLMKESYRALQDRLPEGYDFIFIARNTICGRKCAEVQKSLISAFKRTGVKMK